MDIHPTISPNLCKKNIQKFHQHPSFYFHSKKKLKKGMGRRSNPKSCTNSLHSWKASKIFAMEILFLFYIFKFEFIASQHVTTRHGLIKINFTSLHKQIVLTNANHQSMVHTFYRIAQFSQHKLHKCSTFWRFSVARMSHWPSFDGTTHPLNNETVPKNKTLAENTSLSKQWIFFLSTGS